MITIEEQVEILERHSHVAVDELIDFLLEHREVIRRMAIRRAAGIGVQEYGDETFYKTPEECMLGATEELADAVFYLHVPLAQAAGDVPPR